MPRRNRPNGKQQHGKPGKQSKRPRGWHRDYRSSSIRQGVKWLQDAA